MDIHIDKAFVKIIEPVASPRGLDPVAFIKKACSLTIFIYKELDKGNEILIKNKDGKLEKVNFSQS